MNPKRVSMPDKKKNLVPYSSNAIYEVGEPINIGCDYVKVA